VIYDPVRNDLFTATKGRGAFLNDKRIRVTNRTKLQDSLIGTGFPFRDFTHLDTYLAMLKSMIQKTTGIRRPGSAALDLAYVAAGYTDGFFEINLSTWDIAAWWAISKAMKVGSQRAISSLPTQKCLRKCCKCWRRI
jgi:myo-inositol-1(or 4)-monophosphatase